MPHFSILVRSEWDSQAGVFVATSEDVPGLVAEAPTPAELMRKLEVLIPELLALNSPHLFEGDARIEEVPLFVMNEQVTKLRLHA